jgi:exopolysaccharide biosynthesis polyprenyl glycosylphosphotransferase
MNRKKEISKDLQMILDGLLMGLCLWIGYEIRVSGWVRLDKLGTIPDFFHSLWLLGVIIPATPLLLDLLGFYDQPLSQSLESLLSKIAKAGFFLILVIGVIASFGRFEIPSRSVLLISLILAPFFLILRSMAGRKILRQHYIKGTAGDRSVLVGSAKDAEVFLAGLSMSERLELQISKQLDADELDIPSLRKSIREQSAGRVIFVSPDSPKYGDLPLSCEDEGLDVWFAAGDFHGIKGTPDFEKVGNNQMIVFRTWKTDSWNAFFKRLIDIAGSAIGIILLLPVALVIALAIKLTSPGPVIFRQVRSGKRGRRFTIYKFRSMIANAPELHAELGGRNEMEGPVFKITHDPRVTRIGALLRNTSLDEIPQLFNVLIGDMSLVGPRPLPDYETEQIEKSTHRRRLSVKPGITCFWQIRGRNSIKSFDEWVQMDIEYIERASLLLDLWIIVQTIPAVLFRRGAR